MSTQISKSKRSLIFKEEGNPTIIWKILGPERESSQGLNQEFELLQELEIDGLRKAFQKGVYQNKEAFSYEYFEGDSLKDLISRGLTHEEGLRIIQALLKVLIQLHENGIWHLALNSNHILYNQESGNVCLIDLSRASRQSFSNPMNFQDWEDELAYMAPEQSGRLNQKIDKRADLYSLGIILYELLAAELPFRESQPANLLHQHLIQIPEALHEKISSIPLQLSLMVEKLLKKNPEDRYQTSLGLSKDLDRFLEEGNDARFDLGSFDQSSTLQLSKKIYGRDKEQELLRSAVDKLAQENNLIGLLSGKAGMGKTSLIQEVKKYVIEKNGILISGTFDQVKQNIPHQAMVSALKELSNIILSESEQRLEEWKGIITRAVGDVGQVLLDLVPEFELIIGKQSKVLEIPASQMENRTNFMFQRILQEISGPNRPVILFLDDLQWAELSAWKTILAIASDSNIKHFMLVLASRTEDNTDFFKSNLEDLLLRRPDTLEISLETLSEKDIFQFIQDSFQTEEAEELSKIVYNKTLGYPFFCHQFLESLERDKHLQFVPSEMMWKWDKEKLKDVKITDNVISFIQDKIETLSEEDRKVLDVASCMGLNIERKVLRQCLPDFNASLPNVLQHLREENLLVLSESGNFAFAHDRIRQTVYDLIPEEEKSRIHYTIGDIQRNQASEQSSQSQIFYIANHFRLGHSLVKADERLEIQKLLYEAGMEAKKSTSFDLAAGFFDSAVSLTREEDWERDYDFAKNLYNEGAESIISAGEVDKGLAWLDISHAHAKGPLDKVRPKELKINYLNEQHRFPEAISLLLEVFEELGFGIKRDPNQLTILREFAQVKWLLRGKSMEDIANLAPIENEIAFTFIKISIDNITAIFGSAPDILPLVIFKQMKLSLKYGNSVYSPYAFASYGFAISAFMGAMQKGYEFGELALKMVKDLDAKIVETKVNVVFYGFLSYWMNGIRESAVPLQQAYFKGRLSGDLLFASFAASFDNEIRFHAGDKLHDILKTLDRDCINIKNLNQEMVYNITAIQRQLVQNLLHRREDQTVLDYGDFDEEGFLRVLEEFDDQASTFDFYYYKMALACIYNEYDKAYSYGVEAEEFAEDTTARQIIFPTYLLFSAFANICQLRKEKPLHSKGKIRKRLNKKVKLLRLFNKFAPQNYQNKLTFLEGMLADLAGDADKAQEQLYKAIELSKHAGFIHEEAFFRESLAEFYYRKERKELAEIMLQKAYDAYKSWGAKGKITQLEERYPHLSGEETSISGDSDLSNVQNIFDLASIIESNQALSSQHNLGGLLTRMMEIIIQNASATYATIILPNQQKELKAQVKGNNKEISILDKDYSSSEQDFPQSLINYAFRSKENISINNLSQEKQYAFDSYVKEKNPVSAACIPILAKDNILGIIYLENNLAEAAFDPKRISFFSTISAQLGISIENASLYENLEAKVAERTREIVKQKEATEAALESLKSTQSKLVESEKMASLGQLTAGIAHEINNPINFVKANIDSLKLDIDDLKSILAAYHEVQAESAEEKLQHAQKLAEELDLNFLLMEIDKLIEDIKEGAIRTSDIVSGLRNFSRLDEDAFKFVDINKGIDSTLTLLNSQLRDKVEVHKDYSELELVECLPGKINQVLMNILTNSIQAIPEKGDIFIKTEQNKEKVYISIKDTGTGMSDEVKNKIFEPFFTTKDVGEGTGLGLSISYGIIERHGGEITVNSTPSVGTEFIVSLPITQLSQDHG